MESLEKALRMDGRFNRIEAKTSELRRKLEVFTASGLTRDELGTKMDYEGCVAVS